MGKYVIEVLDAVHCRANKHARQVIKRCLSYKEVAWKRARFGREQKIEKHHLITGREGTSGLFLTGLLPRIKAYCKKRKIRLTITTEEQEGREIIRRPKVKDITFRPDQEAALGAVRRHHRGKIVFPTGTGKTIIALGIISMFPNYRILILCHTKDLVQQLKDELGAHGYNKIQIVGAGYKVKNIKRLFQKDSVIVIGTIQSFSKIDVKHYRAFFDLTIVDEVHHVNSRSSQYGKVMTNNLSPRRYGLTATEPTKAKEILINEGFFGPTIAKLTEAEGIEKGIIAEPIVNLISVPYDMKINQKCKYRYGLLYDYGIVKNRARSQMTVAEAIKTANKGQTVLIVIERTEHGKKLKTMLKYKGIRAPFIHGGTDMAIRNKTKKKLNDKKVKIVICSKVWKEGINIPTLNHIINAVGMKEEKQVRQAIGRGFRTAEGKTTIKLTDFLDPYRYLAEHSILRIQIYAKEGWL